LRYSLVVTITVTCYSWAPSSGDHFLTCGAIFWPRQGPFECRVAYLHTATAVGGPFEIRELTH